MSERGWEAVTFEGVRRAQLRDQMRLSPEERLRWLEEALEFAARVQVREAWHETAPGASPNGPASSTSGD